MGIETTPVYPVATVAASAPPPYTVGVGAAPVTVEMQPVVMQPVYATHVVQPQATVMIACTVKHVDYDGPYLEFCPRCQTSVTTRVTHNTGACWWTVFIIGCFVCWPIWFWLCCNSSKDVRHFCPNCATQLAVKKRGC